MKAQFLVLLAFLGIAQAQILPPEEHPSLLFTAQDIPLLRERTGRQPYASWWKTVEQRALTQPSANDDERAKVRQAKSLAFVYVITGDETRAREAAELLETVQFPPRGGDMGEPHLEGEVVALFAAAYDMLHGYLQANPDQLGEIRDILAEEAHRLYRGIRIDLGVVTYRLHDTPHLDNWHLRVYGGLGLAAFALSDYAGDDSTPADWAGRAFQMVAQTLDFQIDGTDGGYAEGPFYARYAADLYLPYLLALKGRAGIDLFRDPKVEKMHDWSVNLRLPNGRRPNIDDGHIDDFYGHYLAAVDDDGGVHRWDWENNEAGLYVREFSEMDAIAFYDDRIEARPPDRGPSIFMPTAGDAVFRSDWSADATYMLLRGEHGNARERGLGHEHPDETSFLIYAGREMLSLDAGYINFPNHNKVNKGRNHSLVLVDGDGPPLRTVGDVSVGGGNDAFLENFYTSHFIDYAEVRARYEDVDVLRRVMFVGRSYFIVADELRGDREHLYEWRLHGNGGGTSGGQYGRSGNLARWTRGETALLAYQPVREGWILGEADALHSFSYLQELTHTALTAQQRGENVEFLTVLYPRTMDDGPEPMFATLETGGGEAVRVETVGQVDLAWVRHAGATTTVFDSPVGTVESDARIGFLRFKGSKLQALAMQAGGFLRLQGVEVIVATSIIDVNLKLREETASGFARGSAAGYQLSMRLGRAIEGASHEGVSVTVAMTDDAQALQLAGEGELALTLGAVEPLNTAVTQEVSRPTGFRLEANWPNPFNSQTQILYQLPDEAFVTLDVLDLTGQRVRSLVTGHRQAGANRTLWDGTDDRGYDVGTGIYMMRLRAGPHRAVRKMLILR